MTGERHRIFVDVTSAASQVMLTGVQRIVRSIARVARADPEVDPVFATWSDPVGGYFRLRPMETARLERIFDSGIHGSRQFAKWSRIWRRRRMYWNRFRTQDRVDPYAGGFDQVWIPEIFPDRRVEWFRARLGSDAGLRTIAFFHDAITLQHPEWTPPGRLPGFGDYLDCLASMDRVVAPSESSARALRGIWETDGVGKGPAIRVEPWPIAFRGPRRTPDLNLDRPCILSVGSLEPRKNHLRLLDAAMEVAKTGLQFRLVLIGRAVRPHTPAVFAKFKQVRAAGVDLVWSPQVTDQALADAYAAAWFTVFPSLAEGYGLPVDESLWFGRPCICSDRGAVGERSLEGGCLTVDVERVDALSAGILRLLTERETLLRLIRQARARSFPDWESLFRRILLSPNQDGIPEP